MNNTRVTMLNVIKIFFLYIFLFSCFSLFPQESSVKEVDTVSIHDNSKLSTEANFDETVLLSERQKIINETRRQLVIGFVIIFLISFGFVYLMFKKYQKAKRNFNENLIIEHSQLKENEKESYEIKQLTNPAFNEVVQLAKSNSPEFPIRFKEVYPEFCKRLLDINPELQPRDLKFCAFISLNFSTKDIAEFTHITPRSVQSKKYRIRKKLKLQTDEDIYMFMSNLMDGVMS